MKTCSRCQTKVDESLKFCISCGNKFAEKIEHERFQSRFQNSNFMIPVLSGIGVIILLYSLFVIFELSLNEITVNGVLIFGYTTSALSLIIGLIIVKKSGSTTLFGISMLMLSEGMTYMTSFFYDLAFRSIQSRYFLLGISLLIATFGTLSSRNLVESSFQMIHRVIACYIGWITILYLGGTDYISTIWFTLAIIYLIVILQTSGVLYPSLPILGSSIIIESLVLLDTEVINTSNLFWVAIIHVALLPVMLYLVDKGYVIIKGVQPKNLHKIFRIYFIPLVPIFIAMGRGAILAPFSHIVIAVFSGSWILYLTSSGGSKQTEQETLYKTLMAYLLTAVLIFYTINNKFIDSLIMEILVILVLHKLRDGITIDNQTITRFLIFIPVMVMTKLIYVDEGLGLVLSILHIIMIIGFTYRPIFSNLYKMSTGEIYPLLFGFTLSISIHFILRQTSVSLIYFYLFAFIGAIWMLSRNLSFNHYLVISTSYSIILVTSFVYNIGLASSIFLAGLICNLILTVVAILPSRLNLKHKALSWIIISIPLVLGTEFVKNQWLLNLFTIFLISFSAIALIEEIKTPKEDKWHMIFLFIALWARMINYGDPSTFLNYSSWGISTLVLYIYTGTFFLISIRRIPSKHWANDMLVVIGFLIIGTFISNQVVRFEDMLNTDLIFYFGQLMVIGFMLIQVENLFYLKSYNNQLVQISVIGLLNYIIVLYQNIEYSHISGFVILILMIYIGNKNNRLEESNQYIFIIYVISIFTSLVGFGSTTRLGINMIFIFTYLLLVYSKPILEITKRHQNTYLHYYHELVYIFISLLIFIFVASQQLQLIDGILIFQVISLITLIQTKRKENSSMLLSFSLFYTVLNSIWITSFFELDMIIYKIFESDIIVNIVSIIILSLSWMAFLITLIEVKKQSEVFNIKIYFPSFNREAVTLSVNLILLVLISSLILRKVSTINLEIINIGLILIMTIILVSTVISLQKSEPNLLKSSLIIMSFFVLVETSIIQFFESYISNALLTVLAISVFTISLRSREANLTKIAISISLISVIKFLLDMIFLSLTLDKAISGAFIGLQLLWYSANYKSISTIFSNQSVTKG